VLVRFGQLNSPPIGMFAAATEMYLCERDAGLQPKRAIDILYCGGQISNQQLKKMWERKLHISPLGQRLFSANKLLPGGKAHVVRLPNDEDRHGLFPRSSAHLCFTSEEERLGQAGLRELGLPEGAPFVCVYSRDTGYKSYLHSMHDGNPHLYRNSSIHNYMPAAEELVRRGYFVIRMGAVVNEPLQTTNPMIIDYATNSRSDFMDIFLCAKCSFFLGCTAGLSAVPRIFRRPLVCSNFIPVCPDHLLGFSPECLLIPKKLWLRKGHRLMTFPEFLETWPDIFDGTKHFERIGVDVIENTPEELFDAAVEMEERLKGIWQASKEDEELQQRFWSLLEVREANQEFRLRMSAKFLRQNRSLLD
jgi:putative glycosyltransferase (TIGR04372 family)